MQAMQAIPASRATAQLYGQLYANLSRLYCRLYLWQQSLLESVKQSNRIGTCYHLEACCHAASGLRQGRPWSAPSPPAPCSGT